MKNFLDNSEALNPNWNIQQFRKNLLGWYQANKRDLPFRGQNDPFKIWLSEIMLQQTTVAAVIDYYTRFIKKFPTVKSVALASENDLLRLWQGLGYYSRIRNFKKACISIMDELEGQIPKNALSLKNLPGIGDYTAAAIASIAYGEAIAVVDGNVKRVLARLFSFKEEINSKAAHLFFTTTAQKLLEPKNAGDFNQAMMELGAIICTPRAPRCDSCPVSHFCTSRGNNPEELPKKKKNSFIEVEYASVLLYSKKKILLKAPCTTNLIRNMWELPSLYDQPLKHPEKYWQKLWPKIVKDSPFETPPPVRHNITNKKIITRIYSLQLTDSQLTKLGSSDFKVVERNNLDKIPLNTLSRKVLKNQFGH